MKLSTLVAATAATVCLYSGSAYAFGNSPTCQSMFSATVELGISPKTDSSGQWRAAITNAQASGEVAPTSAAREQWIQGATASQLTFLNKTVDTPEMIFAAGEGAKLSVPAKEAFDRITDIPLNYTTNPKDQAFHYDEVPKLNVTGLGPSGMLKGTLILPVSGHTGLANALSWAKTDKYSIYVTKKGQRVATIVQDAPSKGVITLQEFAMQLTPGEVYQVEYHRGGSGGPGGYSEGRLYQFVWDGK